MQLKQFLVLSLAILLGGCAYRPKQVEASHPLVNTAESIERSSFTQKQQQALNTLPVGAFVDTELGPIKLGLRYTSALGRECREFLVHSSQGVAERNAACKIADQWFLLPQLEQSPTGNLLSTQMY